jgi:hypothetical protein
MKSDTPGIGAPVKNDELKELLKETVATDVKQDDLNRTFGAIDMWNLKRKQRTSAAMRRWLS